MFDAFSPFHITIFVLSIAMMSYAIIDIFIPRSFYRKFKKK